MATDINKVRYVVEVDPNMNMDRSNDVNDYLSIDGWILLNTGIHATTGDSGQTSWVYYAVGWIGEGDPEIPQSNTPRGR